MKGFNIKKYFRKLNQLEFFSLQLHEERHVISNYAFLTRYVRTFVSNKKNLKGLKKKF